MKNSCGMTCVNVSRETFVPGLRFLIQAMELAMCPRVEEGTVWTSLDQCLDHLDQPWAKL